MKRFVQAFFTTPSEETGVNLGKKLVSEHLIGVSYHFSGVTCVYRAKGQIRKDTGGALVLVKAKDGHFFNHVLPEIKDMGGEDAFTLPIIDMIADYRKWIDEEIHE